MPKAIISNRIYLDVDADTSQKIRSALTYKIPKKQIGLSKQRPFEILKTYKVISDKILSIPQGRTDLIPEGYEIVDKRVYHEVPFPEPTAELRDYQVPWVEGFTDSGFLNAKVGWGKTFSALHIARNLGQRTLIVTHNTMLRDQWIEEVEKLYNMPVGVIGSGVFDIEDHAIVVGNVQSLEKVTDRIAKEFGTIIVDECLDYDVRVDTKEFGKVEIGKIVNQQIPCSVLSLNPENGEVTYKKVLRYFKNPGKECLEIHTNEGTSFKCTPNHSVYTIINEEIEKIKAEELEEGSLLIQSVGSELIILEVTEAKPTTLLDGNRYNIEVEDNHTYFANSILVGNCHHIGAETFTRVLDVSYARYKIGLSGTLVRSDGRHVIFKDYFGNKISQPPLDGTLTPTVHVMRTGITLLPGEVWVKKVNNLLYDRDFQEFIAAIAKVQIAKGHVVLIVADRVEFLNNVEYLIGEDCVCITGENSGGVKGFEDRKKRIDMVLSGEKKAVSASISIFKEGISINPLSYAIIATPTANEVTIEQVCGRIQRQWPNKKNPVLLDLVFNGPEGRKQAKARRELYLKLGWDVVDL